MRIPDKLPIKRIKDYHTHYLGRIDDGTLFWGYETFIFTKPYSDIGQGDNWKKYRKEYALVHTFDKEGNYLDTKYWSALTSDLSNQQLADKLKEMVSELGVLNFQDVEIKIFQTEIDATIFGLIVDEETETINLQPNSTISFQEPWDGEYFS